MIKRPAVLIIRLIVLYIVLALIVVWAMPRPAGTIAYLVAGAFAAGVCLTIVLVLYAKFTPGRTARRNGRSS